MQPKHDEDWKHLKKHCVTNTLLFCEDSPVPQKFWSIKQSFLVV